MPFLLVHGLASNCRTWEGAGARLAELGHPVVAVDLRGHGRSDKPDTGYDFATMGADLLAAMGSLGWERPVVELGHGWPRRVAGVVGVDGGALELAERWPAWQEGAGAGAAPA